MGDDIRSFVLNHKYANRMRGDLFDSENAPISSEFKRDFGEYGLGIFYNNHSENCDEFVGA